MNQKGFIHIPLLAIVTTLIAVVSVGTVIVWHNLKNSKISSSADQSQPQVQVIQDEANKENINVEKTKPAETIDEPPSVSQEAGTVSQEHDVELAKAEAEKAKQETEKAKIELEKLKIEQDKLKQIQPVIQQVTPQLNEKQSGSEELKIEKCKSEYNGNKSQRITQYENYEFPKAKLSVENIAQGRYQDCMISCAQTTQNELNTSYVSPANAASISSLCAQSMCSNWTSNGQFVEMTTEAIKKQAHDKIEQQLQIEYQQCLQG